MWQHISVEHRYDRHSILHHGLEVWHVLYARTCMCCKGLLPTSHVHPCHNPTKLAATLPDINNVPRSACSQTGSRTHAGGPAGGPLWCLLPLPVQQQWCQQWSASPAMSVFWLMWSRGCQTRYLGYHCLSTGCCMSPSTLPLNHQATMAGVTLTMGACTTCSHKHTPTPCGPLLSSWVHQ